MPSQIFVDPNPQGVNYQQRGIMVHGSVLLGGSYPSGGEALDWTNVRAGYPYPFPSNVTGTAGNASAQVTNIAPSAGVITVTAANRFYAGQVVSFVGLTTALGLLLNGGNFQVTTATASNFTITTPLTAASGADTGLAVSGGLVELVAPPGPTLTATVSSLAVSAGVITVTATNSFVPGASVSFQSLTTVLGLLMNALPPQKITFANATTFKFANTITGAAGADTGTATAQIPAIPSTVEFWSEKASGYTYSMDKANNLFHVQVGGASASLPSADFAAGAYAAGISGDIIRYRAYFNKD